MSGPLSGLRVIEFAGIGPLPFAAMMLADLGADVLCIERKSGGDWPPLPIVSRGRPSLKLDLKDPEAIRTCREVIAVADVLIEGYRPGVMERLGLGPHEAMGLNPRLVYGRITGWGQTGPLAQVAGHDINYLALSGALAPLAAMDAASPPLNMLGDYAGGSLFLLVGILAALEDRRRSGIGQVIDAAIVDGAAILMGPLLGMAEAGLLSLDPQGNMLGGRYAPFYRTYRCADGKYVAVGALEPRFRDALFLAIGFDASEFGDLDDPGAWPKASLRLEEIFASKSRDEWAAAYQGEDMCLTPVLSPQEAASHPHLVARGSYRVSAGRIAPASAPRFSGVEQSESSLKEESAQDRLHRWGVGNAPHDDFEISQA